MSSYPRARTTSRGLARTITFLVTMLASIFTSTAVAGLDPIEPALPGSTAGSASIEAVAGNTTLNPARADIPPDECSDHFADFCVEVPVPAPILPDDQVPSCGTGAAHSPGGTLAVVSAPSAAINPDAIRVRVEVETGLAIDGACFAGEVMDILNDPRGWAGTENVTFEQVDNDYDIRLILASPAQTDSLCYPARTASRFSCRKESRVVLNLMRWEFGTDDYSEDPSTYRTYLVNHEVGHFLGKGHLRCPGPGELAPVMMQQTKGLGECLPNGWPTKDES